MWIMEHGTEIINIIIISVEHQVKETYICILYNGYEDNKICLCFEDIKMADYMAKHSAK